MSEARKTALRIWTVGHSTRTAEEFVSLLREYSIELVADVRRYPGSRKFPHFNRDELRKLLADNGIRYVWFEDLGGRRYGKSASESPNVGLRSRGFRNYADYMLTDQFASALAKLMDVAHEARTTLMCAELLYWKCHRRLICDTLTAHGVSVTHILGHGRTREHTLTPEVRIEPGPVVVYR